MLIVLYVSRFSDTFLVSKLKKLVVLALGIGRLILLHSDVGHLYIFSSFERKLQVETWEMFTNNKSGHATVSFVKSNIS